MDKFVIAVFPNEAKAYEGTRAIKELEAEGTLSVYGTAVVTKALDGTVSVHDRADQGPAGTAVGALAGGLVGLLGGPAGGALGLASGGLFGSTFDIFNLGVGGDYLDKVSTTLTPGTSAVVAEVDEEWVTPLDTRMRALGGTVLRQGRVDFEDEDITRGIAATEAELDDLQSEYRQAREEDKAALQARINAMRATLRDRVARAKAKQDELQRELDAKTTALRDQQTKARADAKSRREQRIAKMRADYERRTTKLAHAAALAQEAMAP
jgi:uncharacterized membrane protein